MLLLSLIIPLAGSMVSDAAEEPVKSESKASGSGETADAKGGPTEPSTAKTGRSWALLICGHPGNEEHREVYAESVEKLYEILPARYGFSSERMLVQFGSEPVEEDGAAIRNARGKATREEIAADAHFLRKNVKPEDRVWVIVLGHSHYDGRRCYLNLPEPDMHQDDFANLFGGLRSREQAFFVTTPVSGYFVRSLSMKGRVVITATEADREVNETLYHLGLTQVLAEPPKPDEFDIDGDGRATLFDLYIAVARNVAKRYTDEQLLSTEHAQLDDNGDRRSSELQLDYLTVEEGGRDNEGIRPKIRPEGDGALATNVLLFPQPTAQPDEK